ncbi:thioredoxin domain-containing protein [Verrucomicrobiaceae bacterium N1E253]|uniref:Thioredoxin domain-containing protein n=1 Tax=Oceaniferula marina TaxID=2748318 RepID=A0A851GNA2_9BACT|nr:DUF255 domain-containing protein [Oceaniferula marina]NWK56507.1 thioredoxin domain-containing protein [Oceaniferula marina]
MRIFRPARFASITAAILATLLINACRTSPDDSVNGKEQAQVVPYLHQNNLADAHSSLLRSQANSPIHWQTWSKQVFKDAAKEKKTVFAFIAKGTDTYSVEMLKQLNTSEQTCQILNTHHINILVDGHQDPDLEYFTASLCLKSGTPVSTPLLVWFSYEGIPISWIPISHNSKNNIAEFIARTSHTVSKLWQDSPEYVLQNSREDFTRRMSSSLPDPIEDNDNLIPVRAIRQAASLYDPTSSTVDGLIGMSVARHINLLVNALQHPDVSATQREHYAQIACQTADTVMLNGLLDPLDGGIYLGIQSTTSALPVFAKDLPSQIYSMEALYNLYRASGKPRYLEAAESIRAFTNKTLALPDGTFSLGIIQAGVHQHENPCMWTLEEIEAALSPEELPICKQAFDIKGLGNIPLVDDRNRTHFRQNTLTWKTSPAELSKRNNIPEKELKEHLQSITKKLAKLRTEKTTNLIQEKLSTAGTMAQLASCLTTAYRATGNTSTLEDARQYLTRIQKQFRNEKGALCHARFNGNLIPRTAVGTDYTLITKAALDLYEVTLDASLLALAKQVHEEMNEALGNSLNHHLTESDGKQYPYPFTPYQFLSFRTLNNTNTWALAYANTTRLATHLPDPSIEAQATELKSILLATAQMSSIVSIDFLTENAKLEHPSVFLSQPISPELLKTASSKPCQIIALPKKPDSSGQFPGLENLNQPIPPQGALVIQRGQSRGMTTENEELIQLLQ